ncbi:MAG: hypothetical protein JWN25_1618 [Verrucomicrobiales bacterium]|nr:hypothetical protein [Verrucomicrobiales bacterium]
MAGQHLAVFFSAATVGDHKALHGSGYRHVKQTALLVECAFHFGAGVREQAIFQAHDEDVGEFQAFATVHGDQGDRIDGGFFFVASIIIQSGVFKKSLEALEAVAVDGLGFVEGDDDIF